MRTTQEELYADLGETASPEKEEYAPREAASQGGFTTGSDVEIAEHLQVDLQCKYGEVVFCEGEFWHYAETQWNKISQTELWLAASLYNGARHGKHGMIRLNASRIESILKHLGILQSRPGFFNNVPRGVNCSSGFVEYAADGTPTLSPHSSAHLQRDTHPGSWNPNRRIAAPPPGSLIHTLLYGSTAGDPEQPEKIEALLRLAGAS